MTMAAHYRVKEFARVWVGGVRVRETRETSHSSKVSKDVEVAIALMRVDVDYVEVTDHRGVCETQFREY